MQPNTDVAGLISNQVKEYGQLARNKLDDTRLSLLGGDESQSEPFDLDSATFLQPPHGTQPLWSLPIPSSSERRDNLSNVCTFSPEFRTPSQPVSFKSGPDQLSMDEIEHALLQLSNLVGGPADDWFTVNEFENAYTGRGMENFFQCLQLIDDREADESTPAIRAHGTYVLSTIGYDTIILNVKIQDSELDTHSVEFGFLTDGYPLDTSKYRELREVFGMSYFQNASDCDVDEFTVWPEGNHQLDVVDHSTRKVSQHGKDVVTGLFVENPIGTHTGTKQKILEIGNNTYQDPFYGGNPYTSLLTYDYAYVPLDTPHAVSEEKTYILDRVHIQDLVSVFEFQTILNVKLEASVV